MSYATVFFLSNYIGWFSKSKHAIFEGWICLAGQFVQYGRHRKRRNYARISEVLELPNLIEIQTKSYEWFLEEGLYEMFRDISPIEDFTGNLSLEFVDYRLG